MEEFFDIMDVKNEFLKNLGMQYQSMYSPQQLDIALYMLNDFCNNVAANGLVLLRQTPDQPQGYQPPQPQYVQPVPQGYYSQQPRPVPIQNPFNEYEQRMDVQRQVSEMNQGLARAQSRQVYEPPRPAMPPARMPEPQSDVDLHNEKPKTFVDKIKEMRTPKKVDKINPEE